MTEPRKNLESVQIHEPCSANWSAMVGDERRRYCGQCQLHVHNVAAMPRGEAEALIARQEQGEKVCVRLEYAPDGSCVTTEAAKEASPQRAPVLALALGTSLLAACRSDEPQAPAAIESTTVESAEPARIGEAVLMGDIALPAALEDCSEGRGLLMGKMSFTGEVLVNSKGQLTKPIEGDEASGPVPLPAADSPEVSEPDPVLEMMGRIGDIVPPQGDAVDAPTRPATMGTPGPSGPAAPHEDASESAPAKSRVMLGSPGPLPPKKN